MNYYKYLTSIALAIVANTTSVQADDLYEGFIETRILQFDPQSGVKSQHFFFVDFETQTVTSSYETGTTDFFGIKLDSVRDRFVAQNVSFNDKGASFAIVGSTGSGVGFTPSIDYKFEFFVSQSGSVTVNGCHDGYPAYLIQFNGKDLHKFEHKSKDLIKLFGNCDVNVSVSN